MAEDTIKRRVMFNIDFYKLAGARLTVQVADKACPDLLAHG
jgi:hypothetical protein